jgi:hypothetical protein
VKRARATVLDAGRLVIVTVGGRMGEVALLGQMHGVFDKFTRSGQEGPEQKREHRSVAETSHSGGM